MNRRLLVPAVSTAAMLAVLLALGTWQVQRLAWKRDLVAKLDAADALAVAICHAQHRAARLKGAA